MRLHASEPANARRDATRRSGGARDRAQAPGRPGIPPHLIAIDAIGAVVCFLGLWGVFAGGGDLLPFLSTPRIAWSLVAIGVVLMTAVGIAIVRSVLARARPRSPGEQE